MEGKASIWKPWQGLAGSLYRRLPFPLRNRIRWSRGRPKLTHESKDGLFQFLGEGSMAAGLKEMDFRSRYRLESSHAALPRYFYRRNLEVIGYLEAATEGLPEIAGQAGSIKALDIGSRAWEYVIGLERWLRYRDRPEGRRVALHGIELDGYRLFPDLHSLEDYARCFAGLTENPGVTYEVGDMLRMEGGDYDVITHFYPFIGRRTVRKFGLPAAFHVPGKMIAKAAGLTRPGGHLIVFNHHPEEQDVFCDLARASSLYALLRLGQAKSVFLDAEESRHSGYYSVWRKA